VFTEAFLAVASEFDINTKKFLLEKFKFEKDYKKRIKHSNKSAPSANGNTNYYAATRSNFTNFSSGSISKISGNGRRVYKNSLNDVVTAGEANEVDFNNAADSSKGLISSKEIR